MKLEQLEIENFKCFKSKKTFDFGRITVLTGANSSGKSTVMQAILMMLQSQGFPQKLSTNGDYINLGDFKEIANNHDVNNKVRLNINILNTFKRHSFETLWKENEKDFLPEKELIDIKFFRVEKENVKQIEGQAIISLFKFGKEKVNYIGPYRNAPIRTYLEKNQSDFKVGIEGEGYIDQIVDWEKRSNGKIKKLVDVLKDLDLLEEIKVNRLSGGRFELLVRAKNSKILTSLTNVGFGVSQFLPIIVADLQLSDSSTLFLAEPEIHLHPSIQAKFADYLINQITTTEKNYVIETHSEYFLNRLRLAIVKGELKKEDFKIYFLENNEEDTEVFDIDFTKTGAIKNAPRNFFETYAIDVMDIAMNSFAE